MEIKIGVKGVGRELVLEVKDDVETVLETVKRHLAESSPIELSDKRGSKYLVPAQAFAYIEVDTSDPQRVGFGI